MATRAIVLLLIVQLAFTIAARRNNDPLMEGIYQARRTATGMMGGYAGVSKRGPPMAIAGGFATHMSPAYAAASDEEQEEEMMDEEEMEDEPKLDEESEEKIKPVRPAKRPSRKRPQRPRQDEEEDDEGDMMGGGGVTAIATSYSSGKGATSKSHAIAYGGGYKGGRFSR